MIEVERLCRRLGTARGAGVVALDGVTFTARAGEVTALFGPNGSGKTTLLRVLAGILRADTGLARVAGYDIGAKPIAARAGLGLLTQDPALPDRLTPLWHVALHASLRGAIRRTALEQARRALRLVGAAAHAGTPIGTLSRGWKSRIALARAIVHEPRVLLLDEPTSGLDIVAAAAVRGLIASRAGAGRTVLLSTHDPGEVVSLCRRVVILSEGRVVAHGAPADIMNSAAGEGRDPVPFEEACRRLLRRSP